MKSSQNDFSELLIESRRLAKGDVEASGGSRNLRRGISELEEASRYLAGNERQIKTLRGVEALPEADLAVVGFRPPSKSPIFETYDFAQCNIEAYLSAKQEKTIRTIISNSSTIVKNNSEKLYSNWTSREWVNSKMKFMEGLGYRSYTVHRDTHAIVSLKSTVDGKNFIANSTSLVVAGNEFKSELQDPYLAAHAKIIKILNESDYKKDTVLLRPFSMLLEAISCLNSSGADELGYRSLLHAMSAAAGENSNRTTPYPAGYFAPICLQEDVPIHVAHEKRRSLSLGMLSFFERQFEDFVRSQIQQESNAGRIALPSSGFGDSRKQLLKAYVKYLHQAAKIPSDECRIMLPSDTADGPIHIWPYIYVCLRTGALDIARDELEKCLLHGVSGLDSAPVALITAYAPFFTNPLGPPPNVSDALKECRSMYSLLKDDPQCDPYKLAVYNLLSVSEPANISVPSATLEDFLWSQLWCIVSSHIVHAQSKDGTTASFPVLLPHTLSSGLFTTSKAFTEDELYRCILSYGGAEYFDPKRSFPFNYALTLMVCQRYGEAVLYLWNSNRSVAAVHILSSLLHYGLLLPHLPFSSPLLSFRASTGASDLTPCSILKLWTKQFVDDDYADIAVDYMASLNLQWTNFTKGITERAIEDTIEARCQQSIGECLEHLLLICDYIKIKKIVGEPTDDESRPSCRSGGRIDSYLPAADVDKLLSRAAYIKQSRDLDFRGAMYLYTLAGRYIDVIEILNAQLLSSITNENIRDKTFQIGKDFYSKYLSPGHGRVLDHLQRHGRLSLAKNLEFLLNVISFFDASSKQKFEEAIAILDTLAIVAKTEVDVGLCNQRIANVEIPLAQALDFILCRSMETIRDLYKLTKQGLKTQMPGVLSDKDAVCADMRRRAKAIVIQGGSLGQRLAFADTCGKLMKLEMELTLS